MPYPLFYGTDIPKLTDARNYEREREWFFYLVNTASRPVFASLFGIGVGVSTIFVVYSVLRILIDLFLYGIVRLVTAFSQRFLSDGALAVAAIILGSTTRWATIRLGTLALIGIDVLVSFLRALAT